MVAKSNLQETINIPSGLSPQFKEELGRRIVSEVQDRTASGIDKKGKPFKSYSKTYTESRDFEVANKSKKVNLEQTGDMLAELSVILIGNNTITIGYPVGHEDAGKIEGNVIGSFGQSSGNPSKARDFIGLPDKVVNRIVAEIKSEPQFQETNEERNNIVQGILGRFF